MVDKKFIGLDKPDITRFESYLPTAFSSELTLLQKINKIIQDLNRNFDLTNEMVDYLNWFVETFDNKLYETLEDVLTVWVEDGSLSEIVRAAINDEVIVARGEFDSLGDRLDSEKAEIDAINVQLMETMDNVNSLRINVKHLPAPYVSAVGDGITDDTQAFQNAFDIAIRQQGGSETVEYGYLGWFIPVIELPHSAYKVGTVVTPKRFRLKGDGMSVIISKEGSPTNFAGTFVNNVVVNMKVEKIGFLFFDTVFKTPTNNADFSFITFEECNISKLNTLIDMGSYNTSRSTTFKMERCNVSYGVRTLVKLFCDKSHFSNNWFNHSMDSYFMELDTYASFESNVWVPTLSGANKAYIYFTGSDHVRSLHFKEDRFGGEGGSCPIVVVGNVNKGNGQEQYRNQGISFDNCNLASNSTYNPNEIVGGVRAPIILRPTLSPRNAINFISFKNTTFLPDLNQGIVATYNTSDIKSLLPENFVIDFDYASTVSATKGVNKIVSDDLMGYVNSEIPRRNYSGVRNSGKLAVVNTSTTGIKKSSFNVNLDHRNGYIPSYTFLLVTIGQGDSVYGGTAYACQSVYMFTVSGANITTGTVAEISYTKLHGTKGGVLKSANADIITAHFGGGDEGDTTITTTSGSRNEEITIVFGTRVQTGSAYLMPLYDTSLVL